MNKILPIIIFNVSVWRTTPPYSKKWIWNSMPTKRHSICLPPNPTALPPPWQSLTPHSSPKDKRVRNIPLRARGNTPSPTTNPCRRALSLHNQTLPSLNLLIPTTQHNAQTHKKFLERESERREKVADPPWPPPRNAKTLSTPPSSPNKPNAMKVY